MREYSKPEATFIDLGALGDKKMQVIRYILEHVNEETRLLFITNKELAEKAGVSTVTVSKTLKMLQEKGLVERKPGVIKLTLRGEEADHGGE